MEGLNNAFAQRLVTFRHSLGITQEEFADVLGISTKAISAYENGRRRPNVEFVELLIEIYGVSIEFFTGPMKKDQIDEKKREIIRNIFLILELMPEDELKSVYRHLQVEQDRLSGNISRQ